MLHATVSQLHLSSQMWTSSGACCSNTDTDPLSEVEPCSFPLHKGLHVVFLWTFYCKHLTAQFQRERLWLEKLLTRSSKPVSVLYISPRGLAAVQLSQSSVLNVGGAISFQDSAGRSIWYMAPKSLFAKPHIWSFPDARTDERAPPRLSNDSRQRFILVCHFKKIKAHF